MQDFDTYYDEMRELSNFDLNKLIKNGRNLPKEKFRAILTVLESRGALDEAGKNSLSEIITTGNFSNQSPGNITTIKSPFSDPNITNDENAPVLYSRYAVRFFSIIFSPLFGSVLMAINFKRLKKDNVIIPMIALTLIYSLLSNIVSLKFPERAGITSIILNFLGAILLEEFFWNRYIGKEFKFRRQHIMPAFMIGIGLSILLALLMYMTGFNLADLNQQ